MYTPAVSPAVFQFTGVVLQVPMSMSVEDPGAEYRKRYSGVVPLHVALAVKAPPAVRPFRE